MSETFAASKPAPKQRTATTVLAAIRSGLGYMGEAWMTAAAKRRARRQLAEIDDWMLRDIGLTRNDVEREVRKSFPWHASFPWRRDPREPWR